MISTNFSAGKFTHVKSHVNRTHLTKSQPQFGYMDFNGNGFDAMDVVMYDIIFNDSSSSSSSSSPLSQEALESAKNTLSITYSIAGIPVTGEELLETIKLSHQEMVDEKNKILDEKYKQELEDYKLVYLPQFQQEHDSKNWFMKMFHRKKEEPQPEEAVTSISMETENLLDKLAQKLEVETTAGLKEILASFCDDNLVKSTDDGYELNTRVLEAIQDSANDTTKEV